MPNTGDVSDLECYEAALRLAATMRAKQREYFKLRDRGVLIAARTLEKQLDELLRDLNVEELP